MKILIIGDIHGRKFWRQAIANNIDQVNKVIFLGDYLDPYQREIDEDQSLMECNDFYDCQNLLQMLNDIVSLKKNEPDKYILLCGNHTCSYIWPEFNAASRTDYQNWTKYHKFFSQNLNLFNLVWIENNVIFSHAGISKEWSEVYSTSLKDVKFTSILDVAKNLQNYSFKEYNRTLGNISHYRRGDYFNGSCEWADIREHIEKVINPKTNEFIGKGEDGVFQVFGHTQLKASLICDKWACLDCRQGFIFDTETYECNSCL